METQKRSRQKLLLAITSIFFWLIAPVAAHASGDPVVYGMTPARLVSIVAALIGLTSVVMGGAALRSSAHERFKKGRATAARFMGLACIILSLWQLVRATGGFGTGSGKLGAIVAVVFGTSGIVLASIAMARYRRKARRRNAGFINDVTE